MRISPRATIVPRAQIWLAPLDRRTPPRLIVDAADQVSFGAPGELIFRSLAEGNTLARIKTNGTGFERIPTISFLDKGDVSPDGEWVIIHAPATSDRPGNRNSCRSDSWWRSENSLPQRLGQLHGRLVSGREVLLRRERPEDLPVLPPEGPSRFQCRLARRYRTCHLEESPISDGRLALPGARTIEEGLISPGSDPSTYVFTKTDSQRNLFRIPLH